MKNNPSKMIKDLLKLEKSSPRESVLGAIEWRLPDGKLHREHGPAVEYPKGQESWNEYWIHGTSYSEEEFNERMSKKLEK